MYKLSENMKILSSTSSPSVVKIIVAPSLIDNNESRKTTNRDMLEGHRIAEEKR